MWLSNVVLVKKAYGSPQMCVACSNLNDACPKECLPLSSIDQLVDTTIGFSLMSFLDAYYGYHQIRMHP